jgi:hypothetical protein
LDPVWPQDYNSIDGANLACHAKHFTGSLRLLDELDEILRVQAKGRRRGVHAIAEAHTKGPVKPNREFTDPSLLNIS